MDLTGLFGGKQEEARKRVPAVKLPASPGWAALVWRKASDEKAAAMHVDALTKLGLHASAVELFYVRVGSWAIYAPRYEPHSPKVAAKGGDVSGHIVSELSFFAVIGGMSDTGARPLVACAEEDGEPIENIFRLLEPGHDAETAMREAREWTAEYTKELEALSTNDQPASTT